MKRAVSASIVVAASLLPLHSSAVQGGTPTCGYLGHTPYEDENGDPAYRFHIFIENDFNVEMRESTPSTEDDSLSFRQVENAIMQAAEVWNVQARGTSFAYEGPVNANTRSEFCAATTKRPALFVRFSDGSGAMGQMVGDVCSGPGTAHVVYIRAKDGDGNARNFPLGSQGGRFTGIMVHELGHVLDLKHAHEVTPKTCYSVMAYHECDASNNSGGRHLKNYDKDCVKSTPRWLEGRLRGISSTGNFGSFYTFPYGQKKSFFGSTPVRHSANGYDAYVAYFDHGSKWSYAFSDGSFNWSSYSYLYPGGPWTDIEFLDVGPVIYGPRDYGWSVASNGTRVSFLDDENDGDLSVMYNPPNVQYIRTDEELAWSSGDFTYRYCSSLSAPCSGETNLRTHLPLASAWDPVSQNTVFAWVQTTSDETSSNEGGGDIRLIPGFLSSGSYDKLRRGSLVPGNESGAWSASGRTDQPVGLACGDVDWPSQYNCLAAWLDKDQHQGEIRYIFFRVASSGAIDFASNDWFTRGGAETAAGPTVAYIDDRFWLAFRDVDQSSITYQVSSSPYSWNTAGFESGHFPIVEGPTFLHKSDGEAALHFAVSN